MAPQRSDDSAFKRTKIVCTLGPSTDNEEILRGMILGGMNVARINLSHDKMDKHLERMDLVRNTASALGEHVAVMFDTSGPDVRIGELETDCVELAVGAEFTLTADSAPGNAERAPVSFPELPSFLSPGDMVYLDDGLIELEVIESVGGSAKCRIVAGGKLKPRKGINVPGKDFPLPILTDDDVTELHAGAEKGIDYISASFVRNAEDLEEIRRTLGDGQIPIIAKIESASGVENLDEIIESADGVMVARGDLGVEIPPEEVPGVQKRIISACRRTRKPVITATEMLESMTRASRPTRAEIADVANAVLDGTSGVMLSQETAVGDYPVEVVRMMARICRSAERDLVFDLVPAFGSHKYTSIRGGIGHAACLLAKDIDAAAIICVTDSGATAKVFSHYRPHQPVLACTPSPEVARELSIFWGVLPVIADEQETVEALLDTAIAMGKRRGLVENGDRIVFTGNLSGRGGETNLLASVEVGA